MQTINAYHQQQAQITAKKLQDQANLLMQEEQEVIRLTDVKVGLMQQIVHHKQTKE